jgi:mannose-1-phosphate guanylyltransferase
LAGGEGCRLRPLTRSISGDDRPKQFCAVVGTDTLLSDTRRRSALIAPANRTLVVVTKRHECFYRPLLADVREATVVVQPENRGTAPAVLYALFRIAKSAPDGLVAFLPADHFVSNAQVFMAHVNQAFEGCRQQTDLVTLLGITADCAELGYGWIEPGRPVGGLHFADFRRVRQFWEKPTVSQAEAFWTQGWFWNSFVMVGRASTILELIKQAVPSVYEAFVAVRRTLGTLGETEAIERLYGGLPSVDFSRKVLSAVSADLAVLPVRDVYWNDLGNPDRVIATWRHLLNDAIPQIMPSKMPAWTCEEDGKSSRRWVLWMAMGIIGVRSTTNSQKERKKGL